MEKEQWIEKVINSTNGITAIAPSDDLLSKIQQQLKQQETVSPKTVWWVVASIAVLFTINFTLLANTNKQKEKTATVYLENTLNQSNQLY